MSQILLYMKLCSANSHMFVPLQGRTSLHTCIYSQVYTYTYIFIYMYIFHIADTFVYDPVLCEPTYVCALASVHTQNLFAYIHMSQIYIYYITDTFVYQPVLCNLTLARAIASAHSQNLSVYMHILTSIHISYQRYFYM